MFVVVNLFAWLLVFLAWLSFEFRFRLTVEIEIEELSAFVVFVAAFAKLTCIVVKLFALLGSITGGVCCRCKAVRCTFGGLLGCLVLVRRLEILFRVCSERKGI